MTKKKKCSSSSSSRSPKKVVRNEISPCIALSDRPDWLPDDWEMELKRRSGSCRIDRYFVCPVSGKKFRSKWEVMKYSNNRVAGLAIEAPPSPPPLPLPLLRPRRSKNLQPKNQPPKSWRSKDLQPKNQPPKSSRSKNRHVKNWKPKNRSAKSDRKLRDVPVIEHLEQVEDSPAGLPEGWIKEIRARKKGDKTDAYYIDPDHGYGFRSKVDVFRYLENEDLSRVVFILKRVHTPDTIPMIDDSLPIAEFLKCTRKRSASKKRHFDENELISNSVTPQRAAALSLKYASTKFEEGSSETAHSTTTDNEYLEQYSEPPLINYQPDLETDDKTQHTEKQQKECNPYPEISIEECHEQTPNTNFKEQEIQGKGMPHASKDNSEEKPTQAKKNRRLQKRKIEKLDAEPAQTSESLASDTDDLILNTDIGKRYVKLKSKQIEKSMKATEGKLSSLNLSVETGTPQKVRITEPNESEKDMQKNVETQSKPNVIQPTMEYLVEKLGTIKLIDEAEASSQKAHTDNKPDDAYTTGVQKKDETRKKQKSIKFSEESTSCKVNIPEPNDLDKEDVQESDEIREELKRIKISVEAASDGQLQVESFGSVPIFIYSWSDPCMEYAFKTLASDEDNEEDENVGIEEKIENSEPSADQQEQHLDSLSKKPYGYTWSDPCIDFAFKTLTSDFSSFEEAASLQDYLNHTHASSNKSASVPIPPASLLNTHSSKNEKPVKVR